MPEPQLASIVQRMVEAGESESDIAAVIQHYGAPAVGEPRLTAGEAPSVAERIGNLGGVPGFVVGAGKAALDSVGALGGLARMIPGVAALDNVMAPIHVDTEAKNAQQAAGKSAESLAEWIPIAGAGRKAVTAVAARSPKALMRRGGALIEETTQATKAANVPVAFDKVVEKAGRVMELGERGGTIPKSVRDTMRMAEGAVESGTMPAFDAVRDLYSNVKRMSVADRMAATGQTKHAVSELAKALDVALRESATKAGKGAEYAKGMKDYAKGRQREAAAEELRKFLLKKALPAAGAGGAAAVGGKLAWDLF
jgi:hypothetical protein